MKFSVIVVKRNQKAQLLISKMNKYESQISPSIELLLRDFHKEVDDLSLFGVATLRDNARTTIWNICSHFGLSYGVPGNTSRIFEQYVAALVRRLTQNGGAEYASFVRTIVNPQLPLIVACCFQLAAKLSSARTGVTYGAIRDYFLSTGIFEYSVQRIHGMEMEIFRKIGFHLPLYTCMDMAGILATDIAVPPLTLRLAVAFAESAELHRHLIQRALLSLIYKRRIQARDHRITTLHLAASCMVAAIQSDSGLSEAMRAADRLSVVLNMCSIYLRLLSKVILAEALQSPLTIV